MSSPFDDPGTERASHLLLADAAGRLSLWPAFADVPAGWRALTPAMTHGACLAGLEEAAVSAQAPTSRTPPDRHSEPGDRP